MLISDIYNTMINAQQATNLSKEARAADKISRGAWEDIKKEREIIDLNAEIWKAAQCGGICLQCLIRYEATLNLLLTEGYTILDSGNIGELVEKSGRAKPWGSDSSDYFWISWGSDSSTD